MKDSMFELLLSLFEKSLAQLRKRDLLSNPDSDLLPHEAHNENSNLMVKLQNHSSTRVFTYEEQMKLTKASQQFLMKMKTWHMLNEQQFETIMSQLLFSDSRIVNLEETKWVIKNTLSNDLSNNQLLFIESVLNTNNQAETAH